MTMGNQIFSESPIHALPPSSRPPGNELAGGAFKSPSGDCRAGCPALPSGRNLGKGRTYFPALLWLYGAIGGLIAGGLLSIVVLNFKGRHLAPMAWRSGHLIMLIGLSTIFIAIKRQRDIRTRAA